VTNTIHRENYAPQDDTLISILVDIEKNGYEFDNKCIMPATSFTNKLCILLLNIADLYINKNELYYILCDLISHLASINNGLNQQNKKVNINYNLDKLLGALFKLANALCENGAKKTPQKLLEEIEMWEKSNKNLYVNQSTNKSAFFPAALSKTEVLISKIKSHLQKRIDNDKNTKIEPQNNPKI
jgi:hypothetical protein